MKEDLGGRPLPRPGCPPILYGTYSKSFRSSSKISRSSSLPIPAAAAEAGAAVNDAESLSDVSSGGGTTAMVDGADLAVTNTCFRLLLDPEPGVTTTVVADLFRGLDA